ncbi:hypothetical protein OIU84_014954 [Salix udensis]|uniref:Pentatricopeptide repeat-containing protein n=1 Tax=Salix udensis TaxID=889485 RepID=A0AAD6JD65_9ROSI|nr:hypothetical protein OIU84_014954 [Salix udensis]
MTAGNLYSWNKMPPGYAKSGMKSQARKLFDKMLKRDVIFLDTMGYWEGKSWFFSDGSSTASVKLGKQMDGYLIRTNFRPNTIVVSSFIDMYSRCGSLEVARLIFYLMGNKLGVVEPHDLCIGTTLSREGSGNLNPLPVVMVFFPDQEHNHACLIDLLGEMRPSDKLMGQHENMVEVG